jgi:8-oxo-dGTP pyrophosphatase MutT (NUDIX family)
MVWRTLLQDAHRLVETSKSWPGAGLSGYGSSGAGSSKSGVVSLEPPKKWVSAGGVVLLGADPAGMSRVWIRKSAANPGYPSQWTFAKGRVDKGETKSGAAQREVEEEMGLRVSLLSKGYLGAFEGGYSVTHYFLMVAKGSPGRHDKETEKVALMPWEKAMAAFASTGNSRDVLVCKTALAHIRTQFEIDARAGTWVSEESVAYRGRRF